MTTSALEAFFNSSYMPHGHCYLWQPHILWSHVTSDFIIAVSYFSLPVAIIVFALKRKDIGANNLFYLFSSFILLCGITHLIGIFTIWHGIYGIHGLSKVFTAIVSLATAIYVYKLIPAAISIPTPTQYKTVEQQLLLEKKQTSTLRNELNDFKFSRFMLDSMPLAVLVLDKGCNTIHCNNTFEKEFCPQSINPESVFLKALTSDTRTQLKQFCGAAGEDSQEALFFSTSFFMEDNIEVPIELTARSTTFEQNLYVVVTLKNIEEISEVRDKLASSYKKLERAVSATEDGIWEWHVSTNTVSFSNQFLMLIGKNELTQPTFDDWFSHIHPDHQLKVQQAIDKHFRTKEKFIVEYLGKDKQGKYSWFISIGDSEYDQHGNATVMSGSIRNINYAKELEKKYIENTRFLNAIYEGTSHAIWVLAVDASNDFVFHVFNDTACQWFGATKEKIIGRSLTELTDCVFPSLTAKKLRENYNNCLSQGVKVDYVEHIVFADVDVWLSTTLYPIYNSHGEICFIVGMATNITSEKAKEQALSHHKDVLEKVLNSVVCGLYIFNFVEGKNTTINERYTEVLGYQLEELNSHPDFFNLFHPDDIPVVQQHVDDVLNSKNGEIFYIKYRFKHKEGHWVWCYSADRILNYKQEGGPIDMLGTFIDITDEVSLLEQLQDSNESLERFAFVASHDLQEPLRKIMAFSEALQLRLKGKFEGDQGACFELSRLHSAAHRMQRMINDILKLSRINSSSLLLSTTTLDTLLDSVSDVLSLQIEHSSASIKVTGGVIPVTVDVPLMEQVLQNLLSNAMKFCPKSKTPEIHINVERKGEMMIVAVKDNGIGISEKYCKSIFEPFKRLHGRQAFEGSGIGLAICKQVVKIHGGNIKCVSKEGAGTNIIIELPVR